MYFTRNLQLFRIFIIATKVQVDEFMLIPVSGDFIYKELCKLNPSESTGTDSIPARFVQDAASVLTKPIVHIINLSIKQNVIPNDLKNARVVLCLRKTREVRLEITDLLVCYL